MAGYTRQDTANNIANGNVIDADDFDAEYNAVEAAFNASTGHKHDGTAGEGAPIEKVGPSQDLVVTATKVEAKTTNTLDLGSSGVQFKNGYFDGTLNTDVLSVDETSTFTGAVTASSTLAVTGATGIDGDFDINTDKFTVASASGNTAIAGTLAVTGASTLTGDVTASGAMNITGNTGVDGNFDVNTNKFTVASATGNTAVAGTLAVTGTSTLTGAVTASGGVTGDLTGNADTASTWETARSITLTGDVTGTVSGVNGGDNISIATTVAANSVALGTDTTGSYVESLVAGTGVTLTNNSGEGATPTVAIGQAVSTTSDVTFNDVVVSGNLTVSGSTTTVNTETINLADNVIVLNSNEAGTPTQNGGIEVERGTAANKTLIWNETSDKWTVGSETFVAGTFEGALTGNADTATTAGTVTTAAQPNITSVGTLTTLTVDDITLNGSTISDAGSLTIDAGGDITLDAAGNDIIFKDAGTTRGSIAVGTANTLSFKAGTSEEIRLTTSGLCVNNGLTVGSLSMTAADNEIFAQGDIESNASLRAGDHVYVGEDLIMQAGTSAWKFEVGASNELNIYYGATKLFKLDSSGNLTVKANVTAYGTL